MFDDAGLVLIQINARSIDGFSKFNKFKHFIMSIERRIDVIVVGETCFRYSTASLHNLPNYDHYPACRDSAGAGLSVYIRDDLQHTFVEKVDMSFYSVVLKLDACGVDKPVTVVGYYRPPSYRNAPQFLSHFEGVLDRFTDHNCIVIIF